jgi:type II secretory pathway pseudopilin PulG
MVVVMLIAILAALAVPSMTTARNDRVAFNYARQASELIHNARARAFGRGAAHLVFYTSEFGGRGTIFVFEALDGQAGDTGPNPISTCRMNGQWDTAASFTPGSDPLSTNLRTRLIDWLNLNTSNASTATVLEDITMTGYTRDSSGTLSSPLAAIAMCITPNGTTWVGTGGSRSAALTNLLNQTQSFKGIVELDVERHRSSAVVGLTRQVIVAGAGAPRIKSK